MTRLLDMWLKPTSHDDRRMGTRLVALRLRWSLLYPRMCVAAVGYAVIAIFAMGVGGAWAVGASRSISLTVGGIAVAPLVLAAVWDRISRIKAFGVEVTLAEVSPPIAGDHTNVAAELSQSLGRGLSGSEASGTDGLSGPFTELIQNGSKILRIDLRDDKYWWSTRLFLVAALADDFTDVEALVFVRAGDEQIFVGIATPRDVRKTLADNFPPANYEDPYRAAPAAAAAHGDPCAAAIGIIDKWQDAVDQTLGAEAEIKHIVSSSNLRLWMRCRLDTRSVPAGQLTADKQYRIIAHDRRYVALTKGPRLEQVVDRDGLVAAAHVSRRLGAPGDEAEPGETRSK
jgi:hypothetical protein